MLEQLLQVVSEQISAPKADFEKNLRAWLSGTLDRLEIVSYETFMRQEQQLIAAQQAIKTLEQQVTALEQQIAQGKGVQENKTESQMK
ncbi:accessory factor UbiK family protein [Aquirhabdus sp.]|uniref:accessory factor UbiK family protein n=1 Tax=Aquirhabdus sp. TaxID=2824160 RepID=UPI00396CB4AF